jgi:inhibitor of KinA sporulation pathway (predicted exonuclease)
MLPVHPIDLHEFDYFLVVDLESTCCDDGSISAGEHEIIEIGAVMVNTNDFSIVDEFTTFIKPQTHPILTSFCTQLTTISQENVDKAPVFIDATELFSTWLSHFDKYLFCSWGNYDRNHLASDSERFGVENPVKVPHINVKTLFAKRQKVKPMGMKWALQLIDVKPDGVHHRGIDDARNIVKLFPYIFAEKFISIEGAIGNNLNDLSN